MEIRVFNVFCGPSCFFSDVFSALSPHRPQADSADAAGLLQEERRKVDDA